MDIRISISNQRELTKAFSMAPTITGEEVGKAIVKSVFEVEKQANDSNFQFITPRSQRTGWLERSFKFGTAITKNRAEIGPTAKYATIVHKGRGGRNPNPYMPRIANASQNDVNRHFKTAINNIAKKLSRFK